MAEQVEADTGEGVPASSGGADGVAGGTPSPAADEAARRRRVWLTGLHQNLLGPLVAILDYTQMLIEDAEDEGQAQRAGDLAKIRDAGTRLLAHFDQILSGDAPVAPGEMARRLQRQGHEVENAADGEQALAMLAQGDYDAVQLDILMPQMNGFQVLDRMKEDPALQHVPVIMISGLDQIDPAVLFTDIAAFTPYCEDRGPKEIIANLQTLEEGREELMTVHEMQKIKTIGDAFMAAAGLLQPVDNPVLNSVRCPDRPGSRSSTCAKVNRWACWT